MPRSVVLTPTLVLFLVLIPTWVVPATAQDASPAAAPAPVALVWETRGDPESPLADPTSLALNPPATSGSPTEA